MNKETIGLLVGGILPAFLFGTVGVLQKSANKLGIGLGIYLVGIGLGVLITGATIYLLIPDRLFSIQSGGYAVLIGLIWSLGMCAVAVALNNYGSAIAKLAPLYNLNTLIAVILGLWLFAEWKEVNVWRLSLGAIFILLGGALVAKA
jgi:drug/metabolite transporter (DMT)-like permease